MPPTYFLAFALLIGGFAVAVAQADPSPRVLGGYVLALIVVIHATTAILYDEPRYAWTYPHLGVINLIAATGRANRQVDIYNNWPAFFAFNAWFTKTSGLAAIRYAGWAQLFFNVDQRVRDALRAARTDARRAGAVDRRIVLRDRQLGGSGLSGAPGVRIRALPGRHRAVPAVRSRAHQTSPPTGPVGGGHGD